MIILPSIFRLAKEASKYSKYKYQLGCVIVSNGKVVSVGFNSNKTHPIMAKYSPHATLHAEAAALLPLKFKKIKNGVAVVYRESARGKPAMARPCKFCRQILADYGIKEFLYTTSGSWAKEST